MPTAMQSVLVYTALHPVYPYIQAFIEALHPADFFAEFYDVYLPGCALLTANLRRHAAATGDERWAAALGEVEDLLTIAEGFRGYNATLCRRMRAGYALATLESTLLVLLFKGGWDLVSPHTVLPSSFLVVPAAV
ncbi:hypothetical protein AURDEDRAFT_169253 [Auricularia subglabra TFB-10046 SS5]|nr:hypothetical protein AURDEDRAFT_169253 [Auricularia subglabra TFB-10046 SS5]